MAVGDTEKIPVRAVLLDFGGVLADEGFRKGLYALARQQGLDPAAFYRVASDAIYTSGYITGRGAEEDFWRLLQQRTGIRGEAEAMHQAIASRFVLRPRMLAIVRTLRHHGYITGILSDQTDWTWNSTFSNTSIESTTATTWARVSVTPRSSTTSSTI